MPDKKMVNVPNALDDFISILKKKSLFQLKFTTKKYLQ